MPSGHDPLEADTWSIRREKALENADDWRKRAMFQTAIANGAGLIAIGTFVQNGANHDFTAQALMPAAFIFAAGLITGGFAPFLMIAWWERRAHASLINKNVLDARDKQLRVSSLTNDRTEIERLINEGARHHGIMKATAARASLFIGISGLLFCMGLTLSLLEVQGGALRPPPDIAKAAVKTSHSGQHMPPIAQRSAGG